MCNVYLWAICSYCSKLGCWLGKEIKHSGGWFLLRNCFLILGFIRSKTLLPALVIVLKTDFHKDIDVSLWPSNSSDLSTPTNLWGILPRGAYKDHGAQSTSISLQIHAEECCNIFGNPRIVRPKFSCPVMGAPASFAGLPRLRRG